jgi:predicted outer membrane repeat protein
MNRLLNVFIFLLLSGYLSGEILNVPSDYPTINTAISAANEGDTVLVQPGIYYEQLVIGYKPITVSSLYLTTNDTSYISQTILDGNQASTVVTFIFPCDTSVIVNGFTIVNGNGNESWVDGGGICCYWESSPKLQNLVIKNNKAKNGGGIYCGYYSNPVIRDVTIIDNFTTGNIDPYGGGLFCELGASPILENVSFINNYSLYGGGIACRDSSTVTVKNGTFIGNVAYGWADISISGYGGGIFAENSEVFIEKSAFINDTAYHKGSAIYAEEAEITLKSTIVSNNPSGIYCHGSIVNLYDTEYTNHEYSAIELINSSGKIEQSTIRENSNVGLKCINSHPTLINCVISDNVNTGYSNCYGGGVYLSESNPVFRNVLISGNAATTLNGIQQFGGGIYCEYSAPLLYNVTIADNSSEYGSGIFANLESNIEIYNSIAGGGTFQEICLNSQMDESNLTIGYSNINGGKDGIELYGINCTINWLEGNIDQEPEFEGNGDYPYQLTAGSVCIDAGNPDSLGMNYPIWDLMGNYRLWDGDMDGDTVIDMGAYEFGSIGVGFPPEETQNLEIEFRVYPNPTGGKIEISRQSAVGSRQYRDVKVDILDSRGMIIHSTYQESLKTMRFDLRWGLDKL